MSKGTRVQGQCTFTREMTLVWQGQIYGKIRKVFLCLCFAARSARTHTDR